MKKLPPPPPPKHVKGAAAVLWEHYAAELAGRAMLENCDHSALARLCVLEAEADRLAADIAKNGPLAKDRDGQERRSPALLALGNINGIIADLKRSLSLGAYFRHRIGEKVQEEKPLSPLMRLMARINEQSTPPTPPAEKDGTG